MNREQSGNEAEAGLVKRLQGGDPEAFEAVVRQEGGRLLAVARRLLRNEEDAREATQEGFLAAFRSIQGFQQGSRLSTWLHRIVINASLMRLRTRGRRAEVPIDTLLPEFLEDGHRAGPGPRWTETPEEVLSRGETRSLVRRCIDRLPETFRVVLHLRDVEGYNVAETAEILDISPNAVKTRLHRARQALRTLLDPHFRGTGS